MTAEEVFCDLYAKYGDEYYIFHLTYSENNLGGFPKCQKFVSIEEVKEFVEKQFVEEYL